MQSQGARSRVLRRCEKPKPLAYRRNRTSVSLIPLARSPQPTQRLSNSAIQPVNDYPGGRLRSTAVERSKAAWRGGPSHAIRGSVDGQGLNDGIGSNRRAV